MENKLESEMENATEAGVLCRFIWRYIVALGGFEQVSSLFAYCMVSSEDYTGGAGNSF